MSHVNQGLWYRQYGTPQEVLQLEKHDLTVLAPGQIRVKMLRVPINASDLIPVTGAYRHRVPALSVAGYEGVGIVCETSDNSSLLNKRVLPLRNEGTWQEYVTCDATLAIPVPSDIDHSLASRAYINPVAAWLMLKHFNPHDKHVIVTAAGSDSALLLMQWAKWLGAKSITGIVRAPYQEALLSSMGIHSIHESEVDLLKGCAEQSEVVYDAVGGHLAETLLSALPPESNFVSYGLLSGQPFKQHLTLAKTHWFHVRNYLPDMNIEQWQAMFQGIWPLLKQSVLSKPEEIPFQHWKEAIDLYYQSNRQCKPVLVF